MFVDVTEPTQALGPVADRADVRVRIFEGAIDRRLELVNSFRDLERARVWIFASASRTYDFGALAEHPTLERIRFTRGSVRDFSWLPTLPALLDLELWQISKLEDGDLAPLAETHLEALVLGAAPHVRSLEWLPPTLELLELERVHDLDTYAPVARGHVHTVVTADARPRDRSLRPLAAAPLEIAILGDVFPPDELRGLTEAFRGRLLVARGEVLAGDRAVAPTLGWRRLLDYAHERRRRSR